jgi:putative phosphoesterase
MDCYSLYIMWKIGILSDTHLKRLNDKLEEIYRKYLFDMDIVIHAGDYVSVDVVEFLNRDNFHGVQGNMDSYEVRQILPDKKVIEVGSHRIGIIHGWGSKDGLEEKIRNEFKEVDIIVYGHSHSAANHVKDGILFFNPGTAIGYSTSGPHTIGILEIDDIVKGKIVDI